MNLDDLQKLDSGGMYAHARAFADQCERALTLFDPACLPAKDFRSVAFCGMGGSALAGEFVQELIEDSCPISCSVVRGLRLPQFVGPDALVVCSSYSGDTAETLRLMQQAVERGCTVVAVTSGGEMQRRASSQNLSLIQLPSGLPPRAAFGLLLVPLIQMAAGFGWLEMPDYKSISASLRKSIEAWSLESAGKQNLALDLATHLHDKSVLVLSVREVAVAYRWKTLLNENSKMKAFAGAIPESNHNELMAWGEKDEKDWRILFLSTATESAEETRFKEAFESQLTDGTIWHETSVAEGSPLQRRLGLSLLGDFVSIYCAAMRGIDPSDIGRIEASKRFTG
ncbi:MAG: hypothetical protein JSS72_06355 [Armatimonadetes bacterium]|nr:hypothetical protein [Armatimonadota bacterium]